MCKVTRRIANRVWELASKRDARVSWSPAFSGALVARFGRLIGW